MLAATTAHAHPGPAGHLHGVGDLVAASMEAKTAARIIEQAPGACCGRYGSPGAAICQSLVVKPARRRRAGPEIERA
ncbi:MAG: hypothetical protein AAF684_10675, partial [Pseudomonadota bacterium]